MLKGEGYVNSFLGNRARRRCVNTDGAVLRESSESGRCEKSSVVGAERSVMGEIN